MITAEKLEEILKDYHDRLKDVEMEYKHYQNKIVQTNLRINKLQQQIENIGESFAKLIKDDIVEIATLKTKVNNIEVELKRR